MADCSNRLIDEVNALRRRRYPDLIVFHPAHSPIPRAVMEDVSSATGLTFIDFREMVVKVDSAVVPGAFNRTQLRDWLRAAAGVNEGILVTNADEVIAPWDPPDRLAFFREFLKVECREPSGERRGLPIVLITKHHEVLDLPSAGLGQGTVLAI